MKINHIIRNSILALMPACLLSSCDDFLTIVPQNDIVLENFWTEENDVNSVVNSCYSQLQTTDCMQRMLVWGELRSDNLTDGSGTSYDLQQITKENILETNSFTKWDAFYQCINRCNTVIHYAPLMNDPNYNESEMRAHVAEATALRSLCYFYLIRTFRDVPYVTEPSIEDNQPFIIPATKFEVVLDNLIADLEKIKDDAMVRYTEEYDNPENTRRITRDAIYAMLADMYLWKGDYQRCIECCDYVIDNKINRYKEEMEKDPTRVSARLFGRFPLINELDLSGRNLGAAYTEIFGNGHSFESIFELDFERERTNANSVVSSFYGSSSNPAGQLAIPSFIYSEIENGTNKYFRKFDYRWMENLVTESSTARIRKYYYDQVQISTTGSGASLPRVTTSGRNNNFSNWIVYRLTDVILMRSEAEVELVGEVEEGSELTPEQKDHYIRAFAGVSAVWKRANNKYDIGTDTLIMDDYIGNRQDMQNLILAERQRELMFEGKRWFDLVRISRRDGNNDRMVEAVVPKFKENLAAIRIRLRVPDALYLPYNRDELRANPLLQQNPAYETDKTSQNM